MNVSGQVLNFVKYQVSRCFKTPSLCWAEWHWIYGSYFSVLKNYYMLLGGRRLSESKKCIESALSCFPLLFYLLHQPNTWPRSFEFDWVKASFPMI